MNKEPCTTVVKKRGRKSKKELEEIALQKASVISTENINVLIEELNTESESNVNTISDLVNLEDDNETETENSVDLNSPQNQKCDEEKPVAKKRGRKPKGGKIIQQIVPINNNKEPKPNVILHLKCSLNDIKNKNSDNVNNVDDEKERNENNN